MGYTKTMEDNVLNFEEAFKRLEEILQLMNGSELSLDNSLKYYEEADRLIAQCQKHLKGAEKKVEVLIKKRNQGLELDTHGHPIAETFSSQNPEEGALN